MFFCALDEAGDLHVDVLVRCDGGEAGCPFGIRVVAVDDDVGDVVADDSEIGDRFRDDGNGSEIWRIGQEIHLEVTVAQRPDRREGVRIVDPIEFLAPETNTSEERILRKTIERGEIVVPLGIEVTHEPDDGGFIFCESEDPVVILDPDTGFDNHSVSDATGIGDFLEVPRENGPVKEFVFLVGPGNAFGTCRVVEVRVGVYYHYLYPGKWPV